MKRLLILTKTEFKAWLKDPVSIIGGFIPSLVFLIAFSLLFGGELSFKLGYINHDQGSYGKSLENTIAQVESPFNSPYYKIISENEDIIWQAYSEQKLDGVWIIPSDFSKRVSEGENPHIDMYFSNYNDDRAKNHRIYSAEIMWQFYQDIDLPTPPMLIKEEYPLPTMIEWFPVIAVGVILMGSMIGGMVNIFMLTHKEQTAKITIEFGLAPRSLLWVFIPKYLLALIMSLVTCTILQIICYLWLGIWAGWHIWAVWLLAGLTAIFWISLAFLLGLRARHYMAGMIISIISAMTVFFITGGLSLVRYNIDNIPWFSWLFPNIYAVDPLRDLILFNTWPVDWQTTMLILLGFAAGSIVICSRVAARQLRYPSQ